MGELPISAAQPNVQQAELPQAAALKVYLLGGFRVQVDGRMLEAGAFRLQKGRSLIKLLALERAAAPAPRTGDRDLMARSATRARR